MTAQILDQAIQQTEAAAEPQVHIRFAGRSVDVPQSQLDIGTLSTDDQIRNAVATYLDAPPAKLAAFAVDRGPQGELTLRPEAVFG